ncbi:NADH:flavin oxidoreductase/NADH oxidase [Thalassobaculum sp.]|uniref:NADH:flavin oxidoreductase/NADH oxidase n=1 Tax=Thalassobaculum sp. TaxID=2022740 RepID=UPI0032F00047
MPSTHPLLFKPLTIGSVTLPNRVVISPMDQYSAVDGVPTTYHLVHYGKFAMGGAGSVFVEATGVSEDGRITNGCPGLYNADQVKAFRPITDFIKQQRSVPAVQIGHGGRKASTQRPWEGGGPVTGAEIARGDRLWKPFGPSENALAEGWLTPKMMDDADLARTRQDFADAAERAGEAGFDIVEIHMAHGYLLQSFLSPLSNKRNDGYGGDRSGRMRFPLEVAEAVRAVWPKDKPLFVRISSVDGIDDGWEMDDSVALAHELKARGVDVIDCSSGGNSPKGATNANLTRGPGYQVPFAERIKREVGIQTMAVGLIREPDLAEKILQDGRADLIAVGRQALVDPFWALHAAQHFDIDPDFEKWPHQYAWWLEKWDKGLRASKAREQAAE